MIVCDFCGRRGHGRRDPHAVTATWLPWGIFNLHCHLHTHCYPRMLAWTRRHDWRVPFCPRFPLRRRNKQK